MELPALLQLMSLHTCKEAMKTVDVHDLQQHMGQLRAEVRRKEDATAAAQRSAKAERQITDATHKVGRVVINVGDHACQQRLAAAHALALGGHDYGHTTVEEAMKMTGKQLQSYLQFHKQEVHTSWRVPKLLSHVCTHIRGKLAAAAPPQQQLTPAGTTPELAEPAGAPPQQQQQLAAASTSRKRGAPAANKPRAAKQGYEVELFRSSAAYLYANGRAEWAPDNYTFTCMGWDGLMEDLLLDPVNRTCDVGVAGISATSDRIAAGRRIMVYIGSKSDMFLFLKPFDRSVWLLMFATSLLVGLSVMLAEVPLNRIWNRPGPSLTKYSNLQWAASAMLLQATSTFSAKSTGARIIILGWGFMILILINMCVAGRVGRPNGYIAVLASQLTVNSINMNINGINDLISKPLGIFEADLTAFKRFNLAFLVPLPWNNAEDEEVMKESLRSGKVSALALDAPFVEYNVAQSCNFFTVGDIVLPVNLAYAFPPDTVLDHVEYFNQALTVMSETGTMEALQQQFITPEGGCSNKASGSATTVITVNQVAGLWVFFGAAIAAGAVINIGWYLWKKCCCRGEEEEGGVLGSSPSMRNNSLAVSEALDAWLHASLQGSMSMGSMAGGKSFARANPQMAWLGVAEATTHEEAMQVMEGHVRLVDMHLKRLTEQIDSRFAALSENLAIGDVRPLPAPQPSAPPNLRQKSLSARLSKLLTFTKSGSGAVEAGPSHATLQLTPSLRRGDGDQATAPAPPSLMASDAPPAQPPSGAPHSAPGSLPDGSAALPASLVPAGPASTELMALTDI
ncbi:hypothetical protein QJQ45_003534 [Haematococcus lacustris]|nr:hypothetical protein QJQ45_003534 [Haematococcus lacustris]